MKRLGFEFHKNLPANEEFIFFHVGWSGVGGRDGEGGHEKEIPIFKFCSYFFCVNISKYYVSNVIKIAL